MRAQIAFGPKLAAIAAVGLLYAAILALASPAQAANRCSHMSGDPSYACVDTSRANWISVCDRDHDGHKTYARVHNQFTGGSYELTGYDASYQPPCHNEGYNGNIDWFQVCVQTEGCGSRTCTFSGSVWCQKSRPAERLRIRSPRYG